MEEQNELILGETQLKDKIYVIRGVQVMLDCGFIEKHAKRLSQGPERSVP